MEKWAFALILAALLMSVHADTKANIPVSVAKNVWLLPGTFVPNQQPDGNSVIWRGKNGMLVFDTGRHPLHTQGLLDFAQDNALPIAAIINSHWHLDHVGGNILMRQKYPDIAVYASDAFENAQSHFLADYKRQLQGAVADPETTANDKISYSAELSLLAKPELLAPTHIVSAASTLKITDHSLQLHREDNAVTAGDVWVFEPSTGVLAAGDLVTLPAPLFDTACPAQWQQALAHLAAVPFATLIPGHGEPMSHAQFIHYQTAYGNLLQCAYGEQSGDACVDKWITDTASFTPSTNSPLTHSLLNYYINNVLRGKAAGHYCPA